MKVKAKVGFSGVISMSIGQVGEIEDKELLSDLLQAGYVDEVKAEKAEKPEKPSPKRKAVKSGDDK